jgi:hypothetical protein
MENNILLSSFETSVLLCAICTIIFVGTATCRRLRGEQTSLGKRPREDEIIDLPQKRTHFETGESSSNPPVNPGAPQIEGVPEAPQLEAGTPVASPVQVEEVNPGLSQVPPEPATHEVENVAEEPQYGDLPDMGDDRSIIALDDP